MINFKIEFNTVKELDMYKNLKDGYILFLGITRGRELESNYYFGKSCLQQTQKGIIFALVFFFYFI